MSSTPLSLRPETPTNEGWEVIPTVAPVFAVVSTVPHGQLSYPSMSPIKSATLVRRPPPAKPTSAQRAALDQRIERASSAAMDDHAPDKADLLGFVGNGHGADSYMLPAQDLGFEAPRARKPPPLPKSRSQSPRGSRGPGRDEGLGRPTDGAAGGHSALGSSM